MTTLTLAPAVGNSTATIDSRLDEALRCAREGVPVLPMCSPSGEGRCTGTSKIHHPCKSPGKVSLIKGFQDLASTNEATIRDWAKQWPDSNFGGLTGWRSRLIVLDVDGLKGQEALSQLPPLPKTRIVKTGRHQGSHHYFRLPAGLQLCDCNLDEVGKLQVKAHGVIALAGSNHHTGAVYQYIDRSVEIADAPDWLLALAAATLKRSGRSERSELRIIYEGERFTRLRSLAGTWRNKGAGFNTILTRLRRVNAIQCQPQLTDDLLIEYADFAASCTPGGPDPLESAIELVLSEHRGTAYEMMTSLLRHLCETGRRTVLLPVDRISKRFGLKGPSVIGRHRQRLIEEGYLTVREKANHLRGRATVFDVQKIPEDPRTAPEIAAPRQGVPLSLSL